MATITSKYIWNKSKASSGEWDDKEGGFRCASKTNNGITFKLVSGNTALNANAATIKSVSWTASVGTATGISRDKYYFNNFCVYKNNQWSENIGNTTVSNWTVGENSTNGTISRSDAFDIPDGTIFSPETFKGMGGNELKCRISIGNTTSGSNN